MDFDLCDTSEAVRFGDLYLAKKALGKGAFGRVIRCLSKATNTDCAVKIINKTDLAKDLQAVVSEVQILASLNHDHVVKFQGVHQNRHHIFIEMELLSGGSLSALLKQKTLTDDEAATVMKGVLEGVSYLHRRDVLHRDLKPDNLLFQSSSLSSVKVVDFGLSAKFGQYVYTKAFDEACGTAGFMAPEQIMQKSYSKPADIWSCALIMYMAITGKHPLLRPGDDIPTYTRRLQSPAWEFPEGVNPLAQQLFLHMTNMLPLERYTADQALRHPWIARDGGEIPRTYFERISAYNAEIRLKRIVSLTVSLGALLYRTRGRLPQKLDRVEEVDSPVLFPTYTNKESPPSLPSPVTTPKLPPIQSSSKLAIRAMPDSRRRSTDCSGLSMSRLKELRESHVKASKSPLPSKDRNSTRPTHTSYLRKNKLPGSTSTSFLK